MTADPAGVREDIEARIERATAGPSTDSTMVTVEDLQRWVDGLRDDANPWVERTRKGDLETAKFEVRGDGVTHKATFDIVMSYPYNFLEWLKHVEDHLAEQYAGRLAALDDGTVIATASVDMVSFVHEETGEFDITYEGRVEHVAKEMSE